MRMSVFQPFIAVWLLLTGIVTTATASKESEHQYQLIGVSGGLQDGFPDRIKLDFHHGLDDEVKAIYVGRGLVRGYKAFLDVMQPGWRQYADEPTQPLINSNVFASGCKEHANEYWIYLVDTRQVMSVLNNEPRFLSITPDTGKIDLLAMETTKAVKKIFRKVIDQQEKPNRDSVALPIVTAVWFQWESHVPSPPTHAKWDGTEVTNFPDSLALWAKVDDSGRTALLNTTSCPDQVCSAEARDAHQLYWDGIRKAIRTAEVNRPSEEEALAYGPPFRCKEKVRFGVGHGTARINYPFTQDEIRGILDDVGYSIDFEVGKIRIKAEEKSRAKTG